MQIESCAAARLRWAARRGPVLSCKGPAATIFGEIGLNENSLSDSAFVPRCGILVGLPRRSRGAIRAKPGAAQPVHVVYGGAHLFHAGIARRLGELALATLEEYAPDAFTFARAIGIAGSGGAAKIRQASSCRGEALFAKSPEKLRRENRAAWLALTVYGRVREKLAARAGRGFPHRFRGWLRKSSGCGGGPAREACRRGSGARACARARCRHSSESASSRFRRSCATAASARSIFLCSDAVRGDARQAAGKFRRHIAESRDSGAAGRAGEIARGDGDGAGPWRKARCDSR